MRRRPVVNTGFLDSEADSPPGGSQRDGGGQAGVNLGGDVESSLSGDEGILLYGVTGVVRGQLAECKVALGEERLLDTTMPVSMQREGGGVQSHVLDPALEPQRELVPADRGEGAVVARSLEHRVSSRAPILAVDPNELENGLHRAQLGVVGGSQRNLVDTLSELVVFRLGDGEHNPSADVVVEGLDPVPAQDHVQVYLRRRLDQVGGP